MGHTECSPSHLSVAVVFPLVQEGLTKGQEGTSSFLSWAGPQWSLWLFGYIGLIRRLMEWREGPCGLGDSDLGPGPLQESLDLGKGRSGPPAQQFCQVEREGSSGGLGTASQEAGGSRAAWGLLAQLPCGGGWGRAYPGQEGRREPPRSLPAPALLGESVVGRAPPLALVLLRLGDEWLSLPRLGVGAWVTQAALYPLGAGAVTWPRGEDIISAWGRGLLGPHHNAPVIILIILGYCARIPAQPQDLALQLLVHQVHGLG